EANDPSSIARSPGLHPRIPVSLTNVKRANHIDLAFVADFEGHPHIVAAVFAALDRLLVHEFDDVEHLNRSRIFSQHLEDIDTLDLHQLVRRTGVAAEEALGGWELRALASRH